MDKCCEDMAWSLLTMLLLWLSTVLCSAKEITTLTLDSRAVCETSRARAVYWASQDKAILVTGRGAEDRALFPDCRVTIGAATAQAAILRLEFQAVHIQDCGVTLTVNQSLRSDFTTPTSVMAKIGCGHGKVKVMHTQTKHYVRIGVHKDDILLQQYNFRINVTVIDSLPETGPATHVVIIVGLTVLVVAGTALWLLVKYVLHRSQRWHEHCAERNMERAIRLYNSQETPPESDYMYTALPPHDARSTGSGPLLPSSAGPAAGAHRNGHCSGKIGGGRGNRHHRAGEITFVHADGHIETFRMHGSPQERRSREPNHHATHVPHRGTGLAPHGRDRDRDADSIGGDNLGGEDVVGECPPSYEEALHMPTPQDPRSPLYVNLESKGDDNHTT